MFSYIGKCCRCAITALTVSLAFVFNTSLFAQAVAEPDEFFYVDVTQTTQTPDGQTWETAYPDLQDALADAVDFLDDNQLTAHIWVAQGTYTPGTDETDTFEMINRCWIAGGFEGNEEENTIIPGFYARRPLVNLTYLSGEIGDPGNSDNTFHVVTAKDAMVNLAILDGFHIVHGNAVGAPAPSPNPGQMAAGAGGGLIAYHTTTTTDSLPDILRCTFAHNHATYGGAVAYVGRQVNTGKFTNCVFTGNSATTQGGAIFVNAPTVWCPNFPTAPEGHSGFGGVLCTNCLFYDNDGAAVHVDSSGSASLVNCTVTLNGLGIIHENTCALGTIPPSSTLLNCIVYDNGDESFEDQLDGLYCVRYSNVQDYQGDSASGCLQGELGVDIIDEDPDFAAGGFELAATSPCIDTGDPASNTSSTPTPDGFDIDQDANTTEKTPDLELLTRIVGVSSACDIDMGAYEFGSFTCAGDANGNGVDLLLVVGHWGACVTPPIGCAGDISPVACKDGQVNVNDLLLVIGTWGCGGGDTQIPESVDDCWDACTELYPGGGSPWSTCYSDCLESLCHREIIECDE